MIGSPAAAPVFGFLTIMQEPNGFVGGYLVVNSWGRPIEFRLSTAVQPNRVQEILYGTTLLPHLFGEVIGRTLVEKTATKAQAVFTDQPAALELRRLLDVPVGCLIPLAETLAKAAEAAPGLKYHPLYPADEATVRELLLTGSDHLLDLREPLARVRDAISEARKMGVTARAA